MPVELQIPDGNPWWLSPNVWTVPGEDPEGPPGVPREGEPCYLWARVSNTGNTSVVNATTRFYWANPAVGFDRTTANLVGTAFVSLDPGEVSDVLCLTPWVPIYVNEGHECILAEAFHNPADPLPAAPAFNVPTDRHVAQRNISVLSAGAGGMFKLAFEIHNPARTRARFKITARQDRIEGLKALLPALGKGFQLPGEEGELSHLRFTRDLCPSEPGERPQEPGRNEEDLELPARGRQGLTLVGRLNGPAALVHVAQISEKGTAVGGLSAVVIQTNPPDYSRRKKS